MRIAHVVGLSPDGRSLVVATDSGEELAVAADDRLRDALRGIGARHGRLETPMDSSLSPRDIQARIRAGASLEEVTEAAGMPLERVERFAAPVLAEREHLAAMAVSSSVRRRGETSGHRNLRATAAERLLKRGVDVDSLVWDSHRLEDGRWAVTADYTLGDESQRATFFFDPRGRYSVAGDDAARWLIGEQPPGAQATRQRSGDARAAADEPTVDLTDELALVRAIQEPTAEPAPTEVVEVVHEQREHTVVRALRSVPDPQPKPQEPEDSEPSASEPAESTEQQDREQSENGQTEVEEPSELGTLYAMLEGGGDDEAATGQPRGHAGPSDAAAVPDTGNGGWEPAIEVNYPVEPSPEDEAELAPAEHPDRSRVPMDDKASVELSNPVDEGAPAAGQLPGTDEPAPPYARTDAAARAEEARAVHAREDAEPEPHVVVDPETVADPETSADLETGAGSETETDPEAAEPFELESEPAPARPVKRKRASVPSWDEIMFGGPKPPG